MYIELNICFSEKNLTFKKKKVAFQKLYDDKLCFLFFPSPFRRLRHVFFILLAFYIGDVTVQYMVISKIRQTCILYIRRFVTRQLCYFRKRRYQMQKLLIENAYYFDRFHINTKQHLQLQMCI